MEDESCILLRGVEKSFGKKRILEDIHLAVPYGQIYGLLGPSGCGKSSAVKLIAGIWEATAGEVWVGGKRMPNLQLMRDIGYMAQSDALYGDLSARENLMFFGQLYGIERQRMQKRIQEVIQVVDLTKSLDNPLASFSGGMKRRLSLAIAILHEPQILILDEPTVGIDPLLRRNIWRELYRMAGEGVTILVTTHVMDEAEKCGQLSMMRAGRLLASGTPEQIKEKAGTDTIEDAFLYFSQEQGGGL